MPASITIPDALLEPLQALSARSGHSVDEVARDLLSALVTDAHKRSALIDEQEDESREPDELVAWSALRDASRAGRHTDTRRPVRVTVEDTAFLYPSPTARLSFMDDYLSLRLDYRGRCSRCDQPGAIRLRDPLWIETLDSTGEVVITFSAVCEGCRQESNVILLLGRDGRAFSSATRCA